MKETLNFDLPRKSLVEESGVKPSYDELNDALPNWEALLKNHEDYKKEMYESFKLIHQTEIRKTRNAWKFNAILLFVMVILTGYFTLQMKGINLLELIKSLEIL